MKQARLVEVAPIQASTVEVDEYFCDICAIMITNKARYKKYSCDICKRDCHNNGKCGEDHPEDHGDYPRTLCRICIDLYIMLMFPLQQANETAEEEMLERIKRESTIPRH